MLATSRFAIDCVNVAEFVNQMSIGVLSILLPSVGGHVNLQEIDSTRKHGNRKKEICFFAAG
jgi:hypothetical protein